MEPSGYIQSINYPNEYPNNHDAKYVVCGAENSTIHLEVENFFIDEQSDFLQVMLYSLFYV